MIRRRFAPVPDVDGDFRVVVAPDKFAGTITAEAAAAALARGWLHVYPGASVALLPMSDGGPGFLDVVAHHLGGTVQLINTAGPHGQPVVARLLQVDGAKGTAFVEAADCCGLHLAPTPRRPLEATTSGLATVLRAASCLPVSTVVVAVGGTASTDGGRGLVEALGQWKGAGDLVVATDVDHPLLGPAGAARVFGQQKGATDADVVALERRLYDWAQMHDHDPQRPGAGAGGGLGFGLMLLGATRRSGADLAAGVSHLDEHLQRADLVLTGEGCLDRSSLRGKVVGEVARRSKLAGLACIAVAGQVRLSGHEAAAVGIETHSLAERAGLDAALADPATHLEAAAAAIAAQWHQHHADSF